jgi:hypothetical protein
MPTRWNVIDQPVTQIGFSKERMMFAEMYNSMYIGVQVVRGTKTDGRESLKSR